MKEVLLTQGKVAIVDNSDYEMVSRFKWFVQKIPCQRGILWYAVRNLPRANGGRPSQRMHSMILGVRGHVDHIDGDGLNNTRLNIRICSRTQNMRNMGKRVGCSSRFKGVSLHKNTGKWQAYITVDKKRAHLGLFKNEASAASAYDATAKKAFGNFARTNFGIHGA